MTLFEYITKIINNNYIGLKFTNNKNKNNETVEIFHNDEFISVAHNNHYIGIIGPYGLKFLYDIEQSIDTLHREIKEREQVDQIIQDWYDSILEKWYLHNTLNVELNKMEAQAKAHKKVVKI